MTTMWKTLHQLAAPPRLYQICGRLVPWLAAAGIIALATGWVRGFGFAPADYQQGEGYRIMYLHVPAAIWSMGIYAAMAVAAFIRAGLADENGHPCRRGDGAGGGGVLLHRAGHRRGVGQTDVGHLVGVGRASDLGAGAAVSLRRGHRPVARL
ncbi:heme exporter protein C [Salmonella enterica subsp. enterica serovar Daytona]|uniref:Heme exporter protein C n=1 Tax=Salmonella enterica subsp. enterica serovar Daytona TaxID=1962639 RepID=A0A447JFG4_SALET|nr:heme exporter protein C [Salmonella enterica subsp. enterica serovar Daytona]